MSMKLNRSLWDRFQSYLYIDKKLSEKKAAKSADYARFKKVCDYFVNKDFNLDNFRMFLNEMKIDSYSPSYMNNMIKIAKHLDKFLDINQLHEFTFFPERPTIKSEVLIPDEIKRLAEVTIPYNKQSEYINKRDKALVYLLGTTGCRIDEALSLHFEDVFNEPPHVIFRDTKNNDDRIVPIWPYLHELIMQLPRKSDFVFSSSRGGKLDCQQTNINWKRRAEAIGLKKHIYNHLFRHSYITTMLDAGVDWFNLAPLVGHADPKTTLRYYRKTVNKFVTITQMHPLLKHSLPWNIKVQKAKEYLQYVFGDSSHKLIIEEEKGKIMVIVQE